MFRQKFKNNSIRKRKLSADAEYECILETFNNIFKTSTNVNKLFFWE